MLEVILCILKTFMRCRTCFVSHRLLWHAWTTLCLYLLKHFFYLMLAQAGMLSYIHAFLSTSSFLGLCLLKCISHLNLCTCLLKHLLKSSLCFFLVKIIFNLIFFVHICSNIFSNSFYCSWSLKHISKFILRFMLAQHIFSYCFFCPCLFKHVSILVFMLAWAYLQSHFLIYARSSMYSLLRLYLLIKHWLKNIMKNEF